MAVPFARSLRSLDLDGHRRSVLATGIVVTLLGAWTAWALLARVPLVEVTPRARLEVTEPLHRIEAPIDGRVDALLVALGDAVEPGQPLVRLESSSERLSLSEAEARREGLRAQLAPLEAELRAASEQIALSERNARGAASEAQAQERAAQATARLAQDRAERIERLAPVGGATEAQRAEAAAQALRDASGAEAASHAARRARWEQLARSGDVRTRVETVRREQARIEGEVRASDAVVGRLRAELARRLIVAPCAGRVAALEPLSSGRYVTSGAHLLSILPVGELRAVAHFTPGQALGRVRAGQPAQLRLDGFPWTRFGMLPARVSRVADEAGPEGVRVELTLLAPEAFPARLDHGLPGSLEVEVERVSPAELLLRAAGQSLAPTTAREEHP